MKKRILDSVHGYIEIPTEYFEGIIDTEEFQRLRRIEQTSTRSIFPSARHDRFIHSLGVFYLGCKIIENLNSKKPPEGYSPNQDEVFESYLLACLLHDVGHSPFSHTFEDFYENKDYKLRDILCDVVGNEDFRNDWDNSPDRSAAHERMSAIVAVGRYGTFITTKKANKELVARMIIGLYYSDTARHSFENAMIDLIHGDVIDADGLDYVCRDSWASGYRTSNVDVKRLIDSIWILKNPDEGNKFTLCFDSKCMNEIESVMRVKTFQQYYVITHHTVTYEQHLLVKAMESAALHHIFDEHGVEDEKRRTEALRKLCNVRCFYKKEGVPGIVTEKTQIGIRLPMDDDFVSLMKYIPNDKYVKQWFSRKYILSPLWKNKAQFYNIFSLFRDVPLKDNSWIFHNDCRQFITEKFNIPHEDVWIEKATPKYKNNIANKVFLNVNNRPKKYIDLFPEDVQSYTPPQNEFYFIYVPKEKDRQKIIEALNNEYKKYFFTR